MTPDRSTFPRMISVVVPALNAAATLPDQLKALAAQAYTGAWEVVVADNGSIDDTAAVARRFADRLPGLHVVDAADKRGCGHCKNVGAEAARGDFLVFCDADDVVAPGWLEAMAQAAGSADVVRGRIERGTLNGAAASLASEDVSPVPVLGFLPFASGSNVGVRAEVFRSLGGWNEAFIFSEDRDFSWRAQLAGFYFAVATDAVVRKRDREGALAASRQSYRWGRDAPKLYRAFRDRGMQRSRFREVAVNWLKIILGLPYLFLGARRRRVWMRLAAYRLGRVVGSVRNRVIYL